MCSAIWQCSIHLPGLVISTSRSTVDPAGTSGILPEEILHRVAVHRDDEEALAVNVDRMLHRVENSRVIHQPNANEVAGVKAPPDVHVLAMRRGVAEHPPQLA